MTERSAIPANDVEAAWRFFLFNWIITGAMAATLALILAVTNFSIGLTGLLVAVGCVALYAGLPVPMRARRYGGIRESCSCSAAVRKSR